MELYESGSLIMEDIVTIQEGLCVGLVIKAPFTNIN